MVCFFKPISMEESLCYLWNGMSFTLLDVHGEMIANHGTVMVQSILAVEKGFNLQAPRTSGPVNENGTPHRTPYIRSFPHNGRILQHLAAKITLTTFSMLFWRKNTLTPKITGSTSITVPSGNQLDGLEHPPFR
jgi:hypothetical protein